MASAKVFCGILSLEALTPMKEVELVQDHMKQASGKSSTLGKTPQESYTFRQLPIKTAHLVLQVNPKS